jgi:hypothetical protein
VIRRPTIIGTVIVAVALAVASPVAGASLHIQVIAAGGPRHAARGETALPGVLVRVTNRHGGVVAQAHTDATGRVVVALGPGRYVVAAYLAPPASGSRGRECEARRFVVRRQKSATIRIACSIR